MSMKLPTFHPYSQRGVVLIVSLVMLAVITILGAMVMNRSRLEWLMTSNARLQSDSTMRAEASLRVAENTISTTFNSYGDFNTFNWAANDEFYADDPGTPAPNPNALPTDPSIAVAWDGDFNMASTSAAIGAPVETANDYVIDYLGCTSLPAGGACAPGSSFLLTFRAWARSTNVKGAARIAQETFAIQFTPTGGGYHIDAERVAYAEIP